MDKRIHALPQEFLNKLQSLYPQEFHKICQSFLENKPTTFRPNFIKTNLRNLLELLEKYQVRAKRVHWLECAFILEFPSQREFEKTPIYTDGLIYVQNISSMLPVLVLDPQPNEYILDLCAAPGGKTTQLVSHTKGQSKVVAVEIEKPRWCKLEANVKIQGQQEYIELFLGDGVYFAKSHENQFDRVLVDAPCTSESGFDAHNPRSYNYWSPKMVKECQNKQKRLLSAGIQAAKQNATIVYSTCTFSPEENEEVIQFVLEKFAGQIVLQEIPLVIPGAKKGLLSWNEKKFAKELSMTRRVLPSNYLESFYIAKFLKL